MDDDQSPTTFPGDMHSTVSAADALKMSSNELNDLFRTSTAGTLPSGRSLGTALIASGGATGRAIAMITRALFWKGKDFRPTQHDLLNRLTPIGVRAIRATVRMDTSLVDGNSCVVLDYSKTSRIARMIRDEIRQVGPQQYLGLVFIHQRQLPVLFFLDFS